MWIPQQLWQFYYLPSENIEALTAAIDRLMDDKEERNCLAKRAPEVIERFGLE
jgi:uncharacterized protein (DUF924 family)